MDYKRLDNKISSILDSDLHSKTYGDIKEELKQGGYGQDEIKYIMGTIDDRGLIPVAKTRKSSPRIDMIIGGVLCLVALGVVISLYLGARASREVYFAAIALFALGYFIFRWGYKQKGKS